MTLNKVVRDISVLTKVGQNVLLHHSEEWNAGDHESAGTEVDFYI